MSVKGNHGITYQIPVFKITKYTVNDDPTIREGRINVNPNLDFNGKPFPQRSGGWSTEQEEGFRGDY